MAEYTFSEAAAAVGLTPRGLRVYAKKGLLPAATFRGRATRYDEAWLTRLKAVRRLVMEKKMPLDDIRRRIARMSPEEIAAIAAGSPIPGKARAPVAAAASAPAAAPAPAAATAPVPATAPAPESAPELIPAAVSSPDDSTISSPPPAPQLSQLPELIGTSWEHATLLPGLELHLRADATPLVRRIAAEIVAQYAAFPGAAGITT